MYKETVDSLESLMPHCLECCDTNIADLGRLVYFWCVESFLNSSHDIQHFKLGWCIAELYIEALAYIISIHEVLHVAVTLLSCLGFTHLAHWHCQEVAD